MLFIIWRGDGRSVSYYVLEILESRKYLGAYRTVFMNPFQEFRY